jgi:WD40 repeat protein
MLSDIEGRAIRPLASFRDGRLFMRHPASWSPDGKRVLAASIVGGHAELLLIDAHNGAEKGVAGSWAVITAAQWMPDGQSILLSGTEVNGQPLQIWQVFPESGKRTPVTNDLATYVGLSLSSDGTTLVTVQYEITSRVSLVTDGAPSDLTFGRTADGAFGLTWLADGRVLFGSTRSGPAEIWAVNRDGSGLVPLAPGVENVGSVAASHDGRYVFCARTEARASRIWRVDVVSGDAKPITSGPEDYGPVMSTDGQEIYFNAVANGIPRTFRVPANGGVPAAVPAALGNGQPFWLSDILPDGRLLGGTAIQQDDGTLGGTLALLSPKTGAVERIRGIPLAPHPFIPDVSLRVAGLPDGMIAFVDTRDSVPNIWRKPIKGGPAQRVTNFTSEAIFDFAWSKDGKLAVTRGRVQDDLVLIARE